MQFQKVKKYLAKFKYWSLNPQWFVFLNDKEYCRSIGLQAKGLVLDNGCADQYIKHHLFRGQDYSHPGKTKKQQPRRQPSGA